MTPGAGARTQCLLYGVLQGSRLQQLLADSAHERDSGWPADLRVGVSSVLQSRAPPATRQVTRAHVATTVSCFMTLEIYACEKSRLMQLQRGAPLWRSHSAMASTGFRGDQTQHMSRCLAGGAGVDGCSGGSVRPQLAAWHCGHGQGQQDATWLHHMPCQQICTHQQHDVAVTMCEVLPALLQGAQSVIFYELVLEFAAIEAKVLLVDAMRPAVPLAGDDTLRKPLEGNSQ